MSPTRQQVLMYHSVDDYQEDPYLITVKPQRFRAQMAWLKRHRLRGVSMKELLRAQKAARADRLVGLTFDDGYADFAIHALPVLLQHGFTATVFAVTSRLGGDNSWDPLGPRKPLMDAQQLRAITGHGMEVGSHTQTHLSLPGATAAEIRAEVEDSRQQLSAVLGHEVTGLAYPYGHADRAAIDAVRAAGYTYACGIKPDGADRYCLPRTHVGDRDRYLRLKAKRALHRWTWGRQR
ncbi:polysaccharide deacetylase family protein [Nonomuraea soli]|uniref:Peptidoglycan/xylan/chitin deacetylase (PgdA/CDA1 family) n=1 Tax=Nonomuraea soli TaxID=1032476 RepID=A0A7W0HPZ7_9ACTN|nr:polysaccharide deacetylase family protein [Nonomuraea soli]MBA2891399.1 peptidoglycan/xylan/chitin deacetylase (PgdA/CDA1 family) [Nonomuraea soli]